MTKDEALTKIKELEAYVKGLDRPKPAPGQVWRHPHYGAHLLVATKPYTAVPFILVTLDAPGKYFRSAELTDIPEGFTYVGVASAVMYGVEKS